MIARVDLRSFSMKTTRGRTRDFLKLFDKSAPVSYALEKSSRERSNKRDLVARWTRRAQRQRFPAFIDERILKLLVHLPVSIRDPRLFSRKAFEAGRTLCSALTEALAPAPRFSSVRRTPCKIVEQKRPRRTTTVLTQAAIHRRAGTALERYEYCNVSERKAEEEN